MATIVIRCCRCKTIVGAQEVPMASSPTTYTYEPCYDCISRDRLQREKAAEIRRAQQAAKAERN
jgi:hypothetical protein